MNRSLADFIERVPKAELHLHIEGTLEPELLFALAERNRMKLSYPSIQALRDAYHFSNLQSFLDLYYAGAAVLQTEQDFFDLTTAYIDQAIANGIVHAELFFDPQTHTHRGIPMETVFSGIAAALRKARTENGFSSRLILCFLRHLNEADAIDTLRTALPLRSQYDDLWIGVGLDSSELGNPPEKFANVFQQAGELGFHRVAHAGEEGPVGYIHSALNWLQAERIDHGVRAWDDPALVKRLVAEQIPLTVCPLSNVKLQVTPDLREHPLAKLLRAGACVSLHSDDPAYFGGYINANIKASATALDLTLGEVAQLARNSIQASFVPAAQKQTWLQGIEASMAIPER
jgi:adenine deaminase